MAEVVLRGKNRHESIRSRGKREQEMKKVVTANAWINGEVKVDDFEDEALL